MQAFPATIISQYANSPTLVQLITNFNGYMEAGADFDAFYDLIWNIDTAVGYGLDVWGRILGVGRVIQISAGTYLGFEEATDAQPFNQAPFYAGATTTTNFPLSDDAYRTALLAKALANICDGSIAAINQVLLNLFPGRGNCYVTDGGDMTMTYTFSFPLSPVELSIVTNSGVLPRPCGVSVTVVHP
jgi:hypothetical protein